MADGTATVEVGAANESDWGKMTPEQQQAAVDQGVAEAAGQGGVADRSSPQTTDDESAEPENETTVSGDETPAGGDAAKVQGAEGEEVEDEETDSAAWLDQETREFASMMGLTDQELAEFGSREELDRALRIVDRKAFDAGKASRPAQGDSQGGRPSSQQGTQQQEGGTQTTTQTQGQSQGQQASQQQKSADPFADLTQFKLGEQFDEEAAKPINRFVETAVATIRDLQARVARFEQQGQHQAVNDLRRRALESLHSLGNTELFGKPGETPTKEQVANIEKAIETHFLHARGLMASGRQVSPSPSFLKAAVYLAFGDQLSKQHQQQLAQKLRKQSARRTGGASSKPLPKPKGQQSTLEEALADPELDAMFNSMVAERKG